MKVLITGGAGFIGSNVADAYLAQGHDVAIVDNLSTGRRENLNPAAKFHAVDIRDKSLQDVFDAERPQVVNHHAAQISVPASVKDPIHDADVNIIGLLNVLQCSVRAGVRKVIFSSSGGAIYGEADVLPTPEEQALSPFSPYGVSKFVSEQYLNLYRQQHGVDYTVLRYANVYGPRQLPIGEAGVVSVFMEQILKGEVPVIYRYEGEPEGMTRDYCYVGDVVRANILALEKGSGGIFNIGTGVGTSTLSLYKTVLGLMRSEGLAADMRFDSPGSGPARPGDLKRSCLSPAKAIQVLGWRPEHDLPGGLSKTLKWFIGSRGGHDV